MDFDWSFQIDPTPLPKCAGGCGALLWGPGGIVAGTWTCTGCARFRDGIERSAAELERWAETEPDETRAKYLRVCATRLRAELGR